MWLEEETLSSYETFYYGWSSAFLLFYVFLQAVDIDIFPSLFPYKG